MIYQIISWIGFGLEAIFLLIAIILFFSFDIISLHGEVSGKTAAKQMKEIRYSAILYLLPTELSHLPVLLFSHPLLQELF